MLFHWYFLFFLKSDDSFYLDSRNVRKSTNLGNGNVYLFTIIFQCIIWNIKSHIEAEECFKRQLKILTKEGTSFAIVHVCIMKRKKKKIHTCLTTKFRKTNMAMFYTAWNKALAGGYKRLCSRSFVEEPSDVPCEKFRYETSTASQISPVFHDCLFTPSNIAVSYEAYSRTIADKSLSLSLSGLEKLSDRCERINYIEWGNYISPCVPVRELDFRKLGLLSS
ncbi:hypothetical protein V1477_001426 [Vespula maculifrons]|uniref:Uncharacterized protein n=1 Tax=Vespula maculifrons TaxID=7453 RepID=A0ABD2CYY0_VESMC